MNSGEYRPAFRPSSAVLPRVLGNLIDGLSRPKLQDNIFTEALTLGDTIEAQKSISPDMLLNLLLCIPRNTLGSPDFGKQISMHDAKDASMLVAHAVFTRAAIDTEMTEDFLRGLDPVLENHVLPWVQDGAYLLTDTLLQDPSLPIVNVNQMMRQLFKYISADQFNQHDLSPAFLEKRPIEDLVSVSPVLRQSGFYDLNGRLNALVRESLPPKTDDLLFTDKERYTKLEGMALRLTGDVMNDWEQHPITPVTEREEVSFGDNDEKKSQ